MELWDAYTDKFVKIENVRLFRGKSIPDGIFHLVCDVLVQHTDSSILLMKRAPEKAYGGLWEATAGGSALAGETPLQCAVRELREETGIAAERIVELGTEVSRETQSIYVEFLCTTDRDKDNITLQRGETVDFKWVSRDELLSMKSGELLTERMQKYI